MNLLVLAIAVILSVVVLGLTLPHAFNGYVAKEVRHEYIIFPVGIVVAILGAVFAVNKLIGAI